MLGLLLIYWLGKSFYELAGEFKKHQWGFAIAGVASYYGGTFASALLFGGILAYTESTAFLDTNETLLGLMFVPMGLLTCFLFYKFLQRRWENESVLATNDDLLDDGFIGN